MQTAVANEGANAGEELAVKVEWRDLVHLSIWRKFVEAVLPVPWLALSVWCYGRGWWAAALPCSFYFFLTGLRQSHGAQHYSLGLGRAWQDGILAVLSPLMLGSMHAVQASHLHHHRHCLEPEDAEGAAAGLPWWKAMLMGPFFLVRLHRAGWRLGTARQKQFMMLELAAMAGVAALSIAAPGPWSLHFAAMAAGECLTGFFAVWTVHHGCSGRGFPARTQRGRWINFLSCGMFFHAEHHLYPAVPTPRLPELAARLDAAGGAIHEKQVWRTR